MFGKLFAAKRKRRGAEENELFVSHGVYSEMNYCPACGDEYRADQTTCAACEKTLISGSEKIALILEKEQQLSGRSMNLTFDDDLVTLRKGTLKDIKQLQALLAKERIPAMLAGDEQSCGKGCCGPEIYLQVRKSDAEPAMAVLKEDFIKSTALSNHDMTNIEAVYVEGAETNVCPACGCQFSPYMENSCPGCGLCFG